MKVKTRKQKPNFYLKRRVVKKQMLFSGSSLIIDC